MIKLMEYSMLGIIGLLDSECFSREQCRSIENLDALLTNNPNGCFVVFENDEIVGYIFSRVLGNVGFIGPIGVKPAYRGRNLGKQLIDVGIKALISAGCVSIGLEVLPELGNNIGLYLKSQFVPTFSTLTFRKKIPHAVIENNSVIDGKNVKLLNIISFDSEFCSEHNGFSFLKDIELALAQKNSSIYFYVEDDRIKGFLCYSPLIYPFVWGGFLNAFCNKTVFNLLFSKIETANNAELKIRINSRYKKAFAMIDDTFEVERSSLRMVLKDYEGDYMFSDEQSFVARSWIG